MTAQFILLAGESFVDNETGYGLTYRGLFLGTNSLVFDVEYEEDLWATISLTAEEVREAYIQGRFQEVPGVRHVREVGQGSEAS